MNRTLVSVICIAVASAPSLAAAQGSVIRVVKTKTDAPPEPKRPLPRVKSVRRTTRPAPQPRRALPLVPKVSTEAPSKSIAPWVTLAGSIAVGALGGLFTIRTFNAIDADTEIMVASKPGQSVKLPQEFKDQQKAVLGNGIAATVLLSSAAAGAIVSIIMLSSE